MKLLQYLFRLAQAFPRHVALYFAACQIDYAVAILLGGYVARGFLNHLSGAVKDSLDLRAALSLLAVSLVLTVATQAVSMYSSITVMRQSMSLICLNIMERIFKRPGGLALPEDKGKRRPISEGQCLNTLSNDTMTVPGMFNFLFNMSAICLAGIVAFWIMYSIQPFVTLVVFLPLAGLFVTINALSKKIEPLAKKARRSAGEVSSMLSDMFNCVQTVKTSAAEEYFIEEFRRRNRQRLADSLKSELFFTLLRGLNSGLIEIGAGIILLAGAASMQKGTFTVGDFILFTSYLWAVLGIFRWGGNLITEIKRNNVSIGRMEALMRPEPPMAPVKKRKLNLLKVPSEALHIDHASCAPLQTLEVSGLSFRYPFLKEVLEAEADDDQEEDEDSEASVETKAEKKEEAEQTAQAFGIQDIDFSLKGGSLTVITGTIGSGKTTLLRSLLGLLPADAGTVRWNGAEAPLSTELERSRFWEAPRSAYTPQVPRLFSESLQENILLGIPPESVSIPDLVAQACLEQDLKEMTAGLETAIGPRGVRLSGGQVQRAAAARMFARRAHFMVLDDISSALDVETERKLWDRLAGRPERSTFLVVSHREALLRRADQILLMDGGRIVSRGSFEELASESELFRSLLRQQEKVGIPLQPAVQEI